MYSFMYDLLWLGLNKDFGHKYQTKPTCYIHAKRSIHSNVHPQATAMYCTSFCFCLFITLFVCFSQCYKYLQLYTAAQQDKNLNSIYLKFDRFFPSKIDNKKAFLSSNFAMLCAPKRASLLTPSPPSRGSSAGFLRERSISMWLSLIHWAKKNCLANYERKQN